MRVATGTVGGGRIEVAGETLPEGMVVTILSPDDREAFTLGPDAETALLLSIAEAERGEVVSGDDLIRGLRRD